MRDCKAGPYCKGCTRCWSREDRVAKEQAACCVAKRDEIGRLPVGFCGPDCERRWSR